MKLENKIILYLIIALIIVVALMYVMDNVIAQVSMTGSVLENECNQCINQCKLICE